MVMSDDTNFKNINQKYLDTIIYISSFSGIFPKLIKNPLFQGYYLHPLTHTLALLKLNSFIMKTVFFYRNVLACLFAGLLLFTNKTIAQKNTTKKSVAKKPAKSKPSVDTIFRKYHLVSISSNKKTFGTYYGSTSPSVSGNIETGVKEGQFVTYMSSWNLDPAHGGKYRQIMWYNRGNGKAALVSRSTDGKGGNQDSYEPVIDVTGYNVAFESLASNLVTGDENKTSDIFLWQLMSDKITCITCNGNSGSYAPDISKNGEYVAFVSNANNLTEGVADKSITNVYVKNVQTGEIILISKDPKTGKGVGGNKPSISEDGSRIAFCSYSDKLTDGDNNKLWDIFVWERVTNSIKRISFTATGEERNQGDESASRIVAPAISGDGKYVVYATTATNMTGANSSKNQQVYVVEIETGKVVRASSDTNDTYGNGDSPIAQGQKVGISYDGQWVLFPTSAKNLGGNLILKNIHTNQRYTFGKPGETGIGKPALSKYGHTIVFPTNKTLDKRYGSSGIFANDKIEIFK